jgi:bifunctional UDP-N-acetylglucosamine pyrophosphorylase/glucosamine-1-phosphate N-acetyltransferase
VIQAEQLGTAHAVRCALPHLVGVSGSVLICCGDTPLVTARTLRTFMQTHLAAGVDLSVLSMVLEYSTDYGRIVRDSKGRIVGIIEARDASEAELEIREVNTGIYCASAALLRKVIPLIDNANAQGEYYLTDLVGRALAHGWRVQAVAVADPREVMGVNSPEELAAVERLIAQRHTP